MIDFLSIKSEYESYKEYIENTNNTMKCISTFFINFQKNLNDFAQNTKDTLLQLFHNLLKYDNRSTHIKKFYEFCRVFEQHLLKLLTISKKIHSELILPTNDFAKYIMNNNNTQLLELKKIFTDIFNQKKKYETVKAAYFSSCKKGEKQEKILLDEMNKKNSTEYSINNQNTILAELKIESQIECQKYKDEYRITNNLFELNNKKYFNIINSLKDNEEKRINYISFHLEKFISFLEEEKNSLNSTLISVGRGENQNKLMIFKVKLDEDMKIYLEKFNYIYKPNQRFINEDFILYDIYRRNIEAIINNSNNILKKREFDSYDTPMENISNHHQSPNDYNQNIFNNISENISLDSNDLLLYNSLFAENQININKKSFSDFLKKLNTDISFCKRILDKSLGDYFYNQLYHEFKSYYQLEKMAQILIEISKNKESINKEIEINFEIIHIAEKGFYYDEKNKKKIYLCKVIADDKDSNCFKDPSFWKKLLNYKINKTIENYTNKALEEEMQNSQKKANTNIQKLTDTVKYIIDLGTGARNISNLREKKEKEIRNKELLNIIKYFELHFNNFNLDMVYINDIIMEISNTYQLENEQISFLICLINSNMYTIRSYENNKDNNKKNKNAYYDIISNNNNLSKKYLFTNKIINTNNIKLKQLLLVLNSCFMFLEPKNYIKIITLNKFFYSNCQKIIYKQCFTKNECFRHNNYKLFSNLDLANINKHIGMWFYFLKYDQNKTKYKEILKKVIEEDNKENKNKRINDLKGVIILDVNRTYFSENQEEKREIIKNILLCLLYAYPDIGYCQGMNFICQFLLQVTNDEEKTFNIFSAILAKTKYGDLIHDDFNLMKKYFYVFERLINLYLPELFTLLKKNNVSPTYYISPWFITLFTHSFIGNQTKLILHIFDLFILDGWNCIIKIGIMLLKYYQNALVGMGFEELLHFLINDLKEKYDFFNNNNYEKFLEMYQEIKIPKGLVSNIENEFEIEKKIELKQKQREEAEKEQKIDMNI